MRMCISCSSPAVKLLRVLLTSSVEVIGYLCIDANPKVVIHRDHFLRALHTTTVAFSVNVESGNLGRRTSQHSYLALLRSSLVFMKDDGPPTRNRARTYARRYISTSLHYIRTFDSVSNFYCTTQPVSSLAQIRMYCMYVGM